MIKNYATYSKESLMDDRYEIYHDRGLPMIFIGDTFHNNTLVKCFAHKRLARLVSLEFALDQPDSWYYAHQFMAVVTTASFKHTLKESLEHRPVQWFSVVSKTTVINNDVMIGYNTLINNYNVIYDDAIIGNHATVTNHCNISHDVKIEDLCHVSPYAYLCFTDLGTGSCMGLRSSMPGKPHARIKIASWTNILMDSRITKSISVSGTYYGNRKINGETSLDTKIL
jgi:carbonic anhydrase/acetyltransferase-like protein (isoleucine patch superfamily)